MINQGKPWSGPPQPHLAIRDGLEIERLLDSVHRQAMIAKHWAVIYPGLTGAEARVLIARMRPCRTALASALSTTHGHGARENLSRLPSAKPRQRTYRRDCDPHLDTVVPRARNGILSEEIAGWLAGWLAGAGFAGRPASGSVAKPSGGNLRGCQEGATTLAILAQRVYETQETDLKEPAL